MKGDNGGFTLIELLTVISIIGLLSTVALTSLNGARKRARDARRQVDLSNIVLALDQYHLSHGTYFVFGTAWAPVAGVGTGRGWFNYQNGTPSGSYSKSIATGLQEEDILGDAPLDPLITSYSLISDPSGTAHQYKIGNCVPASPDCVCVYADMEAIGAPTATDASVLFAAVGCSDVSAEGVNYAIRHE